MIFFYRLCSNFSLFVIIVSALTLSDCSLALAPTLYLFIYKVLVSKRVLRGYWGSLFLNRLEIPRRKKRKFGIFLCNVYEGIDRSHESYLVIWFRGISNYKWNHMYCPNMPEFGEFAKKHDIFATLSSHHHSPMMLSA